MMLQRAKQLTLVIKPFRTRVELNYDISDFEDMTFALNIKAKKTIAAIPENNKPETKKPAAKKCWAGPPAKYKSIKSVEYDCLDAASKKDAEAWVRRLVVSEGKKQKANSLSVKVAKKKAAEKKRALTLAKKKKEEKKRKLAEENKNKQLAEKFQQEKTLQAEAAAIAASKANQTKINSDITQKMVNVCSKYWDKGEHRCYCQKYIKHAPASIQASSTCK